MKLKLKNKRILEVIGIVGIIAIVIVGIFFFFHSSRIKFTSQREIEINSVVDYTQFVKEIKNGDLKNLVIDSSQVNVKKLGEYEVGYQYEDDKETLKVKVVDSTPPQFDVQSKTIALNQSIDPKELVKNIKDATKTTVAFSKKYSFEKAGQQEVEVVVKDEGGNETRKTVKVNVEEDKKAPEIIAGNVSVIVGSQVDLKDYATAKDNFDTAPQLTVEKNDFDAHKKGNYQVKYIAKDSSGNQSEKTITVQVVDKTDKNEKVVYLTFDDGPSRYTSSVLDILDKYNCKATFFITGMNSSYRKYIKIAHDKGHTIGLHTYSHNYSKVYSSTDAYFKDLEKIGNLAKDYIGFVPKYIRFPGGGSNTVSKKYSKGIMSKLTKMVEEKGYIYYDWNAENGDGYSHMSQSEMLARATSSSHNQIMILMHDANGKQNTVDILPKVIEYYQKRGYTFKAIDDSSIVPHQHVNN
ncbi:MAG: polysaccharide deacetylase family protein [Longibaculum sp.]